MRNYVLCLLLDSCLGRLNGALPNLPFDGLSAMACPRWMPIAVRPSVVARVQV